MFLRTVERQLRGFDPRRDVGSAGDANDEIDEAMMSRAARWGARAVLETLDLGGDPLVVMDTPGWMLEEVEARRRYSHGQRRPSGRPVLSLGEGLDEMASIDVDIGPRPFVVGDVIDSIVALPLVAVGPFRWTEDEAGRQTKSDHRLDVIVPAGTALEIVTVYDKGHASCRPLDDVDLDAWIQPSRYPTRQPEHRIAPSAEYDLNWVKPYDDGRSFARRNHR
jgi:hypothetical protein